MALTFDDDQAAALLTALGLPFDTTDVDTIHATVTDAVGDQPPGDPMPSAVAAAAKRIGFEVIEADSLESLRREATEGRQIKAAAALKAVEDTVGDAIGKGKITASRRKHWVSLIQADPGMAEVLASVPNETAVPLTEIGHSAGSEGELIETAEWFR
jgi:hypothetical protein